jgi:hypothetical protein
MKLAEAKDMVLSLILAGQPEAARSLRVSPASPDGDLGKFLIDGKAARAIHRYNGWLVPISLGWFSGGYDLPVIHGTPFYWYAFAIPERGMYRADHYFICDYLQMRDWVLAFATPLGNTAQAAAAADLRRCRAARARQPPATAAPVRPMALGRPHHRRYRPAPGPGTHLTSRTSPYQKKRQPRARGTPPPGATAGPPDMTADRKPVASHTLKPPTKDHERSRLTAGFMATSATDE